YGLLRTGRFEGTAVHRTFDPELEGSSRGSWPGELDMLLETSRDEIVRRGWRRRAGAAVGHEPDVVDVHRMRLTVIQPLLQEDARCTPGIEPAAVAGGHIEGFERNFQRRPLPGL